MDIELEPVEMSGYYLTSIPPEFLEVNSVKALVDYAFDNGGETFSDLCSRSSRNSITQSMKNSSRSILLDAE